MLRYTMHTAALTKRLFFGHQTQFRGISGLRTQETTQQVSSYELIVTASLPRLKLRNEGPIKLTEDLSSFMTG
jgi:hypothetical protein